MVKNEKRYTSTAPIHLHRVDRKNFTIFHNATNNKASKLTNLMYKFLFYNKFIIFLYSYMK